MGGMGWQVGGRFEREGTYVCAVLYSVASVVSDSVIPLTVAHQALPSMGFSRQEYWSGLPFPPPGDLPNPGIEPVSSALAGGFFTYFLLLNAGKPCFLPGKSQ